MKWKLLLVIGCFHAIASTALPVDLLPTIDLDDYTVLYKGPSGSHYQSGEPGKFVKGVYTFLDSNGRKQQVTYEADARGYRVKTATNNDKANQQAPSIKTEFKNVRPVVSIDEQQIKLKQEIEDEQQIKLKQEIEENQAVGSATEKLKSVPEHQRAAHADPDREELRTDLTEPLDVPARNLIPPPVRDLIPPPVQDLIPPPIRDLTAPPHDESHSVADHHKSVPKGTIQFKDSRRLPLNDKLGYLMGYPFVPGHYVYAL